MGKFIAIEGLDGSGKGTQSVLLCDYLCAMGKKVLYMSFPDYESEGCALVKLYLDGKLGNTPDSTNAYAASMFFAADRYFSWQTKFKNEYTDDTIIVANRYTTANAYHQMSKMPREEWDEFLTWLWDFEFHRLQLPKPDLVLCLLNPPESAISLIEHRCKETGVEKDIHEADSEYLYRSYEAANYAGEKLGWKMLSCVEDGHLITREEMFDKVLFEVLPHID